jgi:hypothetical protein
VAYEFAGFFAQPKLQRPGALPPGGIWREIDSPFIGIGVRLPSLIDEDALPAPAGLYTLAQQLGLHAADSWLYLTDVCWGGDIDFVYGLGFRGGVPFGPIEESAHQKVEAAYIGLMEWFGVSATVALQFEPFVHGYWRDV